ncbi:hypothetical protein GCM10010363_61090 [Streptomyces omiyaensis]|nr:hypothetical protein [Streptomyces omiyaensis]GGY71512.1 hypothetical protein GCM10010363_61090 [Streptomyces omiyaensis]
MHDSGWGNGDAGWGATSDPEWNRRQPDIGWGIADPEWGAHSGTGRI